MPKITKEQYDHRMALVAALRSGKYAQGKSVLKTSDGKYCCLGVACDLYRLDVPGDVRWNDRNGLVSYYGDGTQESMILGDEIPGLNDSATLLQNLVGEYYGLTNNTGRWLASMNDHGSTFDEIATELEGDTRRRIAESDDDFDDPVECEDLPF